MDIERIQRGLADFADARDWSEFNAPNNPTVALTSQSQT